jgi:hypothetical protein
LRSPERLHAAEEDGVVHAAALPLWLRSPPLDRRSRWLGMPIFAAGRLAATQLATEHDEDDCGEGEGEDEDEVHQLGVVDDGVGD